MSSHVAHFKARNKILTAKLLKQDYRYHNFEKLLQNIDDTMNWFLNSRSDQNLFCNRAYRNKNFMVTWSINSQKNVSRSDFSDQFNYHTLQTYWI